MPYLAFFASLQAPSSAFSTPRTSVVRDSALVRHVASLEKQETESPRLTKAKLLLEQFTGEDPDEPITASRRSIAPGDALVPDSYWSNGRLDGSDVVTRYAFRKGVKIAEPLVKYDPEEDKKKLFRQPAKWFVRNIQIAGPLGLWAAGVVSDLIMGLAKNKKRQRAVQLREAISGLGPAIIKAGQALASRPDLLPSEYLEELQKLQDDVPRFSNKLAFATVEEELMVDFDDVFELVEEEPIAAAR